MYLDRINESVYTINLYYTPLLILLGVIGNILCILTFVTGKLQKSVCIIQSTSVYLSTLAISDTMFLLQLLPPWLEAMGYSSIFYKSGFCEINIYISYVTCFMSTWTVVAFTIERFVAVVYPLRRGSVCRVKRARLIVITIAIISLVINLPVLKFTSPTQSECTVNYKYVELAARFNIGDAALAFIVPLGIIFVLNCRIMLEVYKLDHARRRLLNEGQMARLVPPPVRPQQRITRMLLLISTVFVVLNMPAYAIRIVAYTQDVKAKTDVANTGHWQLIQQIASILFNTNFAINFLLYCVSGQNFRKAVGQVLTTLCACCFKRGNDGPGPLGGCNICNAPQLVSVTTSNASAAATEAIAMTMTPCRLRRQGAVRRRRSMP